MGTLLLAAVAGFVGRGIAEQLRPDSFDTKAARIADVIAWRGVAWAVVGAAVALWLTLRLRRRASPFGRLVLGALTGFVAGAGGAAIVALPRYLPDTRPAQDTLNLLSVLEFGFTGALVGALVGWIWSRRGSLGLLAGIVAGMLVELVTIGLGWEVNSASERVFKVGLDAAVIVGFVAATLAILDARQGAPTAASASSRVA
jgi:hypothetical protein